jgi:uncharacterized RDD family membrane protein YckC
LKRAALPLAGFWRRCGALLLDLTIVVIVIAAILLGWGAVTGYRQSWNAPITPESMTGLLLLLLCIRLWLDVNLQGTPGKLLLGCRIIDARTGGRIGYRQALLRLLGLLLAALPAGLGLLRIGWNRNRQGLHDSLSGTLVMLEDESRKSLTRLASEAR